MEERIIGFTEEVEESSFVTLDEGLYEFIYCGYTTGNTNPKDGGQSYPTAIAKLKANNVFTGEVIDTTETFIMTDRWQWKLAQFWKSLGCEERMKPDGKKTVLQGWESKVSCKGYFEATKSKKAGAEKEYVNKSFIEPDMVMKKKEEWSKKNAFTTPTPAPAQTAQPTTNTWSKGW